MRSRRESAGSAPSAGESPSRIVILAVMLGVVLDLGGASSNEALIESTAADSRSRLASLPPNDGKRGITATDLAAGDLAASSVVRRPRWSCWILRGDARR